MHSLNLKKMNCTSKKDMGFTLVELSLVIIIFGIVTIPLLQMYGRYVEDVRRTKTIARVEVAMTQLKLYKSASSSAPCPADRSLSMDNANYGLEDCAAANLLPASGGCNATGGICRWPGARTIAGNTAAQDTVIVGAIPFRTIDAANGGKIGVEGGLDGWGNKLDYAVSASATSMFGGRTALQAGQDFKIGVIRAIDENLNPTAGILNDGLFVVLSHGKTGAGAFNVGGGLVAPCDITTRDGENCDNNATFMKAIGNSDGNSPAFYDDYAYFFKDQSGELWSYVYNPKTASSTGDIYKLNLANVGVNTGATTPAQALTINGGIKAPTVLTDNYCSSTGTNCLPVRYMSDQLTTTMPASTTSIPDPYNGTSKTWTNECASGVANAVNNGQIQCTSKITISIPPGGAGATCPTGYYMNGVLTNGCISCTDGNVYPTGLCN